ncbi:MAG TPA: hypothetical protein VFV52_08160 [Bacilli bacterium]|nr:hypothetical protein [Bacilli bacterium]
MIEFIREFTLLLLRLGLIVVVTLVWMGYVCVVFGCKWGFGLVKKTPRARE